MRLKKETFVAIICTTFIITDLLAIVPVWIYRHIDVNRRETVLINWESLYPFEDDTPAYRNENTLLDQYCDTVRAIEEKLEGAANNNTILRYPLSEIHCRIWNTMGIRKIPSTETPVMVLEDGYLSYNYEKKDNAAVAEKVEAFQKLLNAHKIDFLYVMAPYKCSETDANNLYKGYVDHTRENAQSLAAQLQAHEVNFLNLQELAVKQGIDIKELFFRTDHHWKPSSALWGAYEVASKLNESFGFDIDLNLYNEEMFSVQTYQNFFFGSQGKKVTLAYAKPDDFSVLIPTYPTDYHVIVPLYNLDLNGTFEATMIDQLQLTKRKGSAKYYESNAYAAYGYGDQPLIAIENLEIKNSEIKNPKAGAPETGSNKKVLIIKDSFADTLAPFLSLGLSDLMIVDLRHFTGSLQSCIDDYEPDMVILLMSGGTQHDIYKDYDEHKNMYDFR